jgi:gamma-glutamyltranspeptidase/glutathione hydrolase
MPMIPTSARRPRLVRAVLLSAVVVAPACGGLGRAPPAPGASSALPGGDARLRERRYERGVVASACGLASEVGAGVLGRGGNAVDAAVATAFALAVTFPEAGNLGGGGFLVVRLADGTATSFDFRETAPRAAAADMFLDEKGDYDRERHHSSALAVGVPGSVAGLHLAHHRLGRLAWRDVVEPAVALAGGGFPLSRGLAESLAGALPAFRKFPATLAQFSRGGEPLEPGEILLQPDLARTLERLRDRGPADFYQGETARLLVAEMERSGGLITLDDLAGYRALEREPLHGTYRGHEVWTMPPPSSGGVALLEMLNVLEGYPLPRLDRGGPERNHLLIEAMRRSYADRARHLGDSDFVAVPVARLTSKAYARELRATISPARASRSSPERFDWPREGGETTHLSVVDAEGTAVSLTTTLEEAFGSRRVVPGAGFLLNNEMGDFNAAPGRTTDEGLIGTDANLAAPGKRMLSSMAPAIIARDGKLVLVLGSPGGRTIINSVLETLLGVVDHRLGVEEAVRAPRFHHQWLPDEVRAEAGCFSGETRAALEAMGHRIGVAAGYRQGAVMAIAPAAEEGTGGRGGGRLEAGVDPRRPGAGAAWEAGKRAGSRHDPGSEKR